MEGPTRTRLAGGITPGVFTLSEQSEGRNLRTVTERDVRLREQISNLHSLFVLSMMMTESRDEEEILSLAVTSVSSLSTCQVERTYRLSRSPQDSDDVPEIPVSILALDGSEGLVSVPGSEWGVALPLRSLGGCWGYLVLRAPAEPSEDERFLLRVLAHQTGAALENAGLHRGQRETTAELRSVNTELASVNDRLATTVADLERTAMIHEALTRVAASEEGEEGVTRAWSILGGMGSSQEVSRSGVTLLRQDDALAAGDPQNDERTDRGGAVAVHRCHHQRAAGEPRGPHLCLLPGPGRARQAGGAVPQGRALGRRQVHLHHRHRRPPPARVGAAGRLSGDRP